MNPLKLDNKNRKYYELSVDLYNTDINDSTWLEKYRKLNKMRQVEGKNIRKGFRCFYENYGNSNIPAHFLERFL